MERYLSKNALEFALNEGRTVEQWLGARDEDGNSIIKWLSIERDKRGRTILRVCEMLDEGRPGFADVYEFTPYDSEAEFGVELGFDSPETALSHAIKNLHANPERFVNEGMVQLEYNEYLETRNA